MSLIIPNTFADKSGSIQLSLLDENFNYIKTQVDFLIDPLAGTLEVQNGGTGATTAVNALTNLGAVPLTGATMTGGLTTRGSFGMRGNVAGNPVMYDVTDQAGNTVLEIGRIDNVAAISVLDFHTGATSIDFDTRLAFTGGNGTTGNGTMNISAGNVAWNGAQLVTVNATQTFTNKTISGTSNTISNINLSSQITGTLPVLNGGTGVTSFGVGVSTFLTTGSFINTTMFLKSTGTEGGELRLEKPTTSSLSGDVSLDINGQQFRVFENGGSARGAHIDLTTCATGASSKIYTTANIKLSTSAPSGGVAGDIWFRYA